MALGILQHHDAVAGTAKQKVTDDYIATSLRSIEAFNKLYAEIKAEEIKLETSESVSASDLYFNLFWNETGAQTGMSTKLSAGKTVIVALYNPGAKGTYPIKLRVPSMDLDIIAQDNSKVQGDVVCGNFYASNDCELLFSMPFSESSNSYVKIVPSMGSAKKVPIKELSITEQIKEFSLGGNDRVKFTRGNQSFDLNFDGVGESFKLGYNYYEGWSQSGQHSGAYIFRPVSNQPKEYSSIKKLYYTDGKWY